NKRPSFLAAEMFGSVVMTKISFILETKGYFVVSALLFHDHMAFTGKPTEAHQRHIFIFINTCHKLAQHGGFVLIQIMPNLTGDYSNFSYHKHPRFLNKKFGSIIVSVLQ